MRGRSMMEGLLAWIPAIDSNSPRLWKDCLTVREANESLVTKKSGQVSLTQLNPMDTIFLEIASMGCLLRPSATMGSRCDTQFTHASFTRFPPSSTIHLELVYRGRTIVGLLSWGLLIIGLRGREITRRDTKKKKVNKKILLILSFFLDSRSVRMKESWKPFMKVKGNERRRRTKTTSPCWVCLNCWSVGMKER